MIGCPPCCSFITSAGHIVSPSCRVCLADQLSRLMTLAGLRVRLRIGEPLQSRQLCCQGASVSYSDARFTNYCEACMKNPDTYCRDTKVLHHGSVAAGPQAVDAMGTQGLRQELGGGGRRAPDVHGAPDTARAVACSSAAGCFEWNMSCGAFGLTSRAAARVTRGDGVLHVHLE